MGFIWFHHVLPVVAPISHCIPVEPIRTCSSIDSAPSKRSSQACPVAGLLGEVLECSDDVEDVKSDWMMMLQRFTSPPFFTSPGATLRVSHTSPPPPLACHIRMPRRISTRCTAWKSWTSTLEW